MWPESFIPSQDAQELRVLWAQRREALRKAGRAANRINNIILRFGHTFGATTGMRTTLAQGILDDLINGRSPHIPGAAPDGLPPSIRRIIRDLLQDLQQGQEACQAQPWATLLFECSAYTTATYWLLRLPMPRIPGFNNSAERALWQQVCIEPVKMPPGKQDSWP